jgi:MFS family permease
VGLLASALAAVPLGHYIDRHGARGVMTVGSCAASLLVVAWARVETLPAFYVIWIGLGSAMAAVLYEPAFAVLVRWFVRGRAQALSILTSVGDSRARSSFPSLPGSRSATPGATRC